MPANATCLANLETTTTFTKPERINRAQRNVLPEPLNKLKPAKHIRIANWKRQAKLASDCW